MDADPPPDLSRSFVADHCHLRIDSAPELIAPAVDLLVRHANQCGAVHPGRSTKVMMALVEALTNSVIHGNLGVASELKERGDAFAQAVAARCSDPAFASRKVDILAGY